MSSEQVAKVQARIDRERQRSVDDLVAVVKIPSISSSSKHKKDVQACAEYLAARARKAGFERANVYPTAGHPAVVAEWTKKKDAPTVLIYGHYDVQPVDPLDEWTTPPFEPQVRDGRLFARGAVDDKGQVWAHLLACEAYLQETGSLPVNVKLLVEGEEEIGSEHLEAFLAQEKKRLEADFVIVSDTAMLDRGRPSICYGLRGLAYFEIELKGSSTDLHSGSFGGGVKNPLHALCEIATRLKDPNGKILVPGFFDRVKPLTKEERDRIRALPHDEAHWRKPVGLPAIAGDPDYSLLERLWARPTLDLNGIWGGFQGEGAKTVIPARAHAKLSCRLVPDQTPESVFECLNSYLKKICPKEVELSFKQLHGGLPWVADISHPSFDAAARSMQKAFGADTCYIREGGSIPFVRTIADATKKPCLLLGFGLPDENAHAPNEWLDLDNYQKGIKSCAYLYDELARLPRD